MSDLKLEIDVDAITEQLKTSTKEMQTDLEKGVANLAKMTHAKLLELADENLSALKTMYRDNVEYLEPAQIGGDKLWIVRLKEPALWIEEGRKSGFMEELLDGKSSKTSQDGKKYAVVPFKHNENPSQQSSSAQQLANQIKEAMNNKNISWGKIEYGADGSPRTGKLHSFNVESARIKENHKSPLTYGVNVYQKKQADGSVRRDIMTFRIIHEDHKEEGKWNHPGRNGDKLMDAAFEWATDMWEREIFPKIVSKYE